MFYYLLTHPECYKKLRAEVDEAFPPGEVEPFDGTKLADMKYLNAVM
jgi:cytochrome P450